MCETNFEFLKNIFFDIYSTMPLINVSTYDGIINNLTVNGTLTTTAVSQICSYRANVAQTVHSFTQNLMQFPTMDYNTYGTNLTVPAGNTTFTNTSGVTNRYLLIFTNNIYGNAGNYIEQYALINGVGNQLGINATAYCGGSNPTSFTSSVIITLNNNDYVQIFVNHFIGFDANANGPTANAQGLFQLKLL